jgi:hypothetical protein
MDGQQPPKQVDVIFAAVEGVYGPALSLLLNLEAAQQGRRVLFSDKQKLLSEGGKKGFAKNTKSKLDFTRH